MPDFPSELVEAVAQTETFRGGPCLCGECREAREDAQYLLERIIPLIEQRRTREIVEALRERVLMRAAADFILRTFLNGEGKTDGP